MFNLNLKKTKNHLIINQINFYSTNNNRNDKEDKCFFPRIKRTVKINEEINKKKTTYETNILWYDWKLSNKKLHTLKLEYTNTIHSSTWLKRFYKKTLRPFVEKKFNFIFTENIKAHYIYYTKKAKRNWIFSLPSVVRLCRNFLFHVASEHVTKFTTNLNVHIDSYIENFSETTKVSFAKKEATQAANSTKSRKSDMNSKNALGFNYKNFLNMMENKFSSENEEGYDEYNSGVVIGFKDAVVTVTGLLNVQLNEMIRFEGGASGLVLSLEEKTVRGIVFSGAAAIATGTRVFRTNNVMVVGVGDAVLGRVVNALGEPLDGKSPIAFEDYMRVERKAPGVITRKKVSEPLITGLKVVDALVPIGKGQRELILGDRKTGKTTIAIDTILNQRLLADLGETALFCFYVAIGKRMSEIMRLAKLLDKKGAMSYTTIVGAPASDPASLQYLAPYSACTMAEYFTYKGEHALIIYDDLSKHADAYRQVALLLRRPVGREAYPGDVFYLHSRLLERAVKMNADYLSGSLTALPIIETVQGDVSAYIPTNVISITDGQIYLDLNLHQEGVRPAVDAGLSVSRVGSAAQYKSMKALAGSLKLELAQYREVAQFSKFGSELDAATRKILAKGRLLIEILKQPRNLPLVVYKQVLLLFAASSGFLDILGDNGISLQDYERSLYTFLDYSHIVLPFKRYIALNVDKELFTFFLYYHYDTWMRIDSILYSKGTFNFINELTTGFELSFKYTLLIKRNVLDIFTNLKSFGKVSKRTLDEINLLVNLSKLQKPSYAFFVNRPKKHLLVKCYKDILKI